MKKLFKLDVKSVVAIGIGAALFFALSYVQIPSPIPNTSITARVTILSFFAAVFGPIVGGLVGLIGHAFSDAFMYGSIWWSWAIASGVMGFIIGLFVNHYKIETGKFRGRPILIFNVVQALANIVAWILVAPELDILIYSEPSDKVFTQGILAAISNLLVVGIVTTLLALAYTKTRAGAMNLKKE